jgi:hypothetical protein
MKTKCICNLKFDATVKAKMLDDDLQDIYYVCPRCGEYFHIAYTNGPIREHSEKMQQEHDPVKKQNMMKQHKDMMERLNG